MGIDDKTVLFTRFLEVRSDEDVAELPVFARVEFTERIIQNINYMACILQENDLEECQLYTLNTFDYSPDWYEEGKEEVEELPWQFESTEDIPDWEKYKDCRMDAVTLNVSLVAGVVDFWWEGYIKHTSIKCTTRRVPLGGLQKWEQEAK